VAEAIRQIDGTWSPKMREVAIDKRALNLLGKAPDYDMADRDAELKRLAGLPVGDQRTVAKSIADGAAASVFEAIDTMAAAGGDTDGPAASAEQAEEVPADEGSDALDPVAVYRELLQELPEKIDFVYEHFDDVVGKGLDPAEATEVLKRAIRFFEAALELESDLAKQTADTELTPCGA
jgi:hypothetical protein